MMYAAGCRLKAGCPLVVSPIWYDPSLTGAPFERTAGSKPAARPNASATYYI
jgi:hypothetical protein